MDDGATKKTTSTLYKHMVDGFGCLDHTRAAFALKQAMESGSTDSLHLTWCLVRVYPHSLAFLLCIAVLAV